MGHACHEHHHHLAEHQRDHRAFALATIINLVFSIVEAAYAIEAQSTSLLADAGHNFGDVAGLLLAWGAHWLSQQHSNPRYSYGYKRSTILAALLNALLIIMTTAVIAFEALLQLMHPEAVGTTTVMVIATLGIVINGGTALLFWEQQHDDLNFRGAFLHLAVDALMSLGVVVAAIGIAWTGWQRIDPLVSFVIVVIIFYGTYDLLTESVSLLLDGTPKNIDPSAVTTYLKTAPGVVDVHHLHIWGLSTQDIALTAHLIVPEHTWSDADFEHLRVELKQRFNIDDVTLQIKTSSTYVTDCPATDHSC